MDISKIVWEILNQPDLVVPYKNLKEYYKKTNQKECAEVIEHLIQQRFSLNVDSADIDRR